MPGLDLFGNPYQSVRSVDSLKPHPHNANIYGDQADPELVESVRTKGVLHPLVITKNDVIVSGHRRWLAAKAAGLSSVPVNVLKTEDDLDILEALVHANRQRQKTNEQMGREAALLLDVEKERAKRRQQEAGKQHGKGRKVPERVPEAKGKGDARDKVGEALGVSGKTAQKAAEVVQAVDKLKAEGKAEEAERVRETLNRKGVGPAHKAVKPKPQEVKPAAPPAPTKPTPSHPHSDRLAKWVEVVASQTLIIDVDMGGITELLAERDKWSPRKVKEFILPMLEALGTKVAKYREEIGRAFDALPPDGQAAAAGTPATEPTTAPSVKPAGLYRSFAEVVAPLIQSLDDWGKASQYQPSHDALCWVAEHLRRAVESLPDVRVLHRKDETNWCGPEKLSERMDKLLDQVSKSNQGSLDIVTRYRCRGWKPDRKARYAKKIRGLIDVLTPWAERLEKEAAKAPAKKKAPTPPADDGNTLFE